MFSRRNLQMTVISLVALLAMAYIDYVTGFEVMFSDAYLLPVAICAWYLSSRAVWTMAIASGVASYLVVHDHVFSNPLVHVWNGFMCFVITLVAGLVLHALRNTLTERERANSELQKALDELKKSNEEVLKLQNGLQVICAWTNKVKVGEEWMTAEEFLVSRLHLKVTHGMSPEAGEQWLNSAKKLLGSEPPTA